MNKIELTEEQKEKVLKEWDDRESNPPSLLELIRIAYPEEPYLDGRSKEGKAVKAFLATREIKPLASHQYQPKKIELTEDYKEFIDNNFGFSIENQKDIEDALVKIENDLDSYQKRAIPRP